MTLRHFFSLVLVIVGVAYVQWLVVLPPLATRPASLADEPWKVPGQPQYDTAQALAALNKASLWGKLADSVVAPVVDSGWRFLGAMARGQERYVIVKVGNQLEQKLVSGDNLPDGTKILSIDNDRICVLINNKKRTLAIYSQGPLSGKMSSLAQ